MSVQREYLQMKARIEALEKALAAACKERDVALREAALLRGDLEAIRSRRAEGD